MAIPDSIRVSVIGQVGVAVPDSGFRRLQPAQRQLLCLLVAAGPAGMTADRLADEIWPDRLPQQWQSAVRMTVSRLRTSSGANFVELIDGYYRLMLDVDQVDAWYLAQLTERSNVTLTAGDVGRLGDLLGSADIYGGVAASLTIEASARVIEAAQRNLITAASASKIKLPRPVLRSLYRRVLATGYDEELCLDVAHLHAVVGAREAAHELIEHTRIEIKSSFGTPVSDELMALDRKLASGAFGDDGRGGIEEVRIEREGPTLPLALQMPDDLPDVRSVEAAEVAALLASALGIVVLTGPAGSGARYLSADALRALGANAGVVLFGSCSEGVSHRYEPFAEMLPSLRALLARNLGSDQFSDQTSLWSAAAQELTERSGGGPLTVVIAEAHDIDSASSDLLTFLARSTLEFPLRLLISGRSDIDRPEFARLQRQLGSLPHVHPIDIRPLTVDQVSVLVASRFPHASSAVLRSLSEELQARSGGLLIVVAAILDTLDPTTLRLPDGGTGQSLDVFSQLVANLDATARSVGVAAAVLGRDASLNDLQMMTDLGPDELMDVIEDLLNTGLLVETAGVDRLRFANQLAQDEFIQQAREIRLRQLHMKARNLTRDPHRRARHDLLAHPTVPSAEVRSSQLRSARLLHAEGAFREAAAAFRAAQSVQPDVPLRTIDATAYADAVSRTGASSEAANIRSDVIARCVADGDWDGVLAASIVGLPEAEKIDGDPERFAQLSSIPPDRLSAGKRFELAIHLTRQASLLGREEVSTAWVQRATESARTPAQQGAAALAWRLANDVKEPAGVRCHRVDEALDLPLPDHERMLLLQVSSIDSYQLGHIDRALELNEAFAALAASLGNPLRQWHAELFSAMHSFTMGNWDQASAQYDAALHDGQRFGVTIAGPTRVAQEFCRLWTLDEHDSLLPLFDAMPPDDESLLFEAAYAVTLFDAGLPQRAIPKAIGVANRFLSAPAAHGLASVALLAPVLAESGDSEVVERVSAMLVPHSGSALLVGAGVANLGPVDRFLDQLDGGTTVGSARELVEQADGLSMPLWRLITRLELHALEPTRDLKSQVVTIAAGTSFEQLLPR